MVSATTDRRMGLVGSIAVKAPCKAVTTTSITLSGEQTVGGVSCVEGDRVLVAITGGSVNNGVWDVSTGAWTRSIDFNGNLDIRSGTLVLVSPGSSARFWQVTNTGTITIGSTALVITQLDPSTLYANAGQVYFDYSVAYAAGTVGAELRNMGIDVTQPPYNCDKTGAADCSTAINLALTTYPGVPLRFPKGTYRCDATINLKPATAWGAFGPGQRIQGEGMGVTFFDNRVANGPLFDIDSASHGGVYSANMGSVLSDFNIITTTSPAASIGIRALDVWQLSLERIVIKGMTYYGVHLLNGAYSDDGWNMVSMKHMYIEDCHVWGLKADGSAARNEGSYTLMEHVFFQTNGVDDSGATPPTSGAMIWKGQVLTMEQVAAANGNANVAFYIKGQSGLAQTVDMRNCTSENTRGWGIYCTGVHAFKARNSQFYNNTNFTCDTMVKFDGATYDIRHVEFDGCTIRNAGLNMAGSVTGTVLTITGLNGVSDQKIVEGSPGSYIYAAGGVITAGTYVIAQLTNTSGTATPGQEGTYSLSASSAATGAITITGRSSNAFQISGVNAQLDTCRVRRTNWENFDFPNQTRFSGWHFDPVPQQCELAVLSTTSLVLRAKSLLPDGDKTPVRLSVGNGGVTSTSGELVSAHVTTKSTTNAGLAASTRYYVYVYDTGSSNFALELSTTAYATDTTLGLLVKTGDASRIYVGSVKTTAVLNGNGGYEFDTASSGWLNPVKIASYVTPGTYLWAWYSAGSTAPRYTLGTLPTTDTDGVLL